INNYAVITKKAKDDKAEDWRFDSKLGNLSIFGYPAML
nr:hypothetical protein [Tanacetum cinerariifolium]